MWRRNRDDRDVRYGRDEREWRDRFENDYGRDYGRGFERHRGQQMPDRADAGEELYRRMRDDRGPFRGRDDYDRDFDRNRYGASRVERPDFYRDTGRDYAPPVRREFNPGYDRDFDYDRDRGEIRSDYRGSYRDRFDFHPGRGFDATPNHNSDRDRDYGFRGGEDRPRSRDWDRDRDRERERWDRDSGSEEWYRDRWRR